MFTAQQRSEIYDAIVHQSDARVAAYCDVPFALEVLGVRVRYLNLRDLATLQFCGCAFFCENSKVQVVDAIKVLWLCSKDYDHDSKSAKAFARKICKQFSNDAIVEAVAGFVDDNLLDCGCWGLLPGEQKDNTPTEPPHYTTTALLVAEIASAYHWSESDILSMPLPRVYQYFHLALANKNPEYKFTQLSEHLVRKFMFENRKKKKSC